MGPIVADWILMALEIHQLTVDFVCAIFSEYVERVTRWMLRFQHPIDHLLTSDGQVLYFFLRQDGQAGHRSQAIAETRCFDDAATFCYRLGIANEQQAE